MSSKRPSQKMQLSLQRARGPRLEEKETMTYGCGSNEGLPTNWGYNTSKFPLKRENTDRPYTCTCIHVKAKLSQLVDKVDEAGVAAPDVQLSWFMDLTATK